MPWSFSGLYAQATPRALACLRGHAVLGPALHHLRSLGADGERGGPAPPKGGLLALPAFGPADNERLRPEVPWDALLPDRGEQGEPGEPAPRISFADPREVAGLRERGLSSEVAPPRPTLVALKQLSLRIGGPLVLYRCEMWGGDVELEAAWVPGWVSGEVDRLFFYDARERCTFRAVGAAIEPSPGDVLVQALEFLRLRLPAPYFAPHTSRFDWGACRLAPAPAPAPALAKKSVYMDMWVPTHPRSLLARVHAGDLVGARALLDAGADPNAYGWRRPLAVAASLGDVALVELLLDRGAEIVHSRSLSALHDAATAACARLLLDRGAPIEGSNERVITPLASAAARGDDGVVRLLLERGASLRPPGREGLVWFSACRGGLAWLVERILDERRDESRDENRDENQDESRDEQAAMIARRVHGKSGQTGLMVAAAAGHGEVAALLVRRGATLDAESLVAAAEGGLVALVEEHLARGVAATSALYGRTALEGALRGAHLEVSRLLLDHGADPARVVFGQNHLHRAADVGSAALVDLLLERHPDPAAAVRARDDNGWTPLFAAVWGGHEAAARRLIAAGAELDVVDESGRELAAIAAERGLDLSAMASARAT